MRFSLNDAFRATGTRFALYAQSPVLDGFAEPETIYVSSPRGTLLPGPADDRMYVIQPHEKQPYAGDALPPFRGPFSPMAMPSSDGHFDHLSPDDPGFRNAHMFGTVRRVLDIWEIYLGGPIPWSFANTHPRLELIPYVPWDNAHFGWGFIECGEGKDDQGVLRPFALNFDILAHETGHGMLFSIVGMPQPETLTTAYRGFHESASDCIAMISALHFDTFIDHVLNITQGNLFVENEMNRIGELSRTRQIRRASNAMTLRDVIAVNTDPNKATGKQIHALGQPLTGAVFDVIAEFFLDRLIALKVVDADSVQQVRIAASSDRLHAVDSALFSIPYHADPKGFAMALAQARDMLGLRLAECWRRLTPDDFTFEGMVETLLTVDAEISGPMNRQLILECFEWRGLSLEKVDNRQ